MLIAGAKHLRFWQVYSYMDNMKHGSFMDTITHFPIEELDPIFWKSKQIYTEIGKIQMCLKWTMPEWQRRRGELWSEVGEGNCIQEFSMFSRLLNLYIRNEL